MILKRDSCGFSYQDILRGKLPGVCLPAQQDPERSVKAEPFCCGSSFPLQALLGFML
jgi:hypothetical protein